jgi:hypothetical protein
MVRLGSVALIAISLPAAAWSNPPSSSSEPLRTFHLPQPAADRFAREDRIGRTQIAPNTHFGFGMFGLKSEKSPLRPVTGREIDAPKQRRAAVGFSLRF